MDCRAGSVGQLRAKSYSYLIEPQGEADPIWFERFKSYWLLHEKVYGVEFYDRLTMAIDRDLRTITCFAVIKRILPGRRVPVHEYQGEARH
mgnify:CR=1 FL=1